MTMLIADDRTYKVTSAYMHIACVYRKAGCPFMLKLTKAKEGGWIMKTPKSTDVDLKQRSNYRCRHPLGSLPEEINAAGFPLTKLDGTKNSVLAPGGPQAKEGTAPRTSTTSSSSRKRSGSRRESAVVKRERVEEVEVEGKSMPSRETRPARTKTSYSGIASEQPLSTLANHSPGAPSKTVVSREGEDLPRVVYLNQPGPDRALAPPFERSVSLQSQISPVLQQGQFEVGPDGRPFIMEGGRMNYYTHPPVAAASAARNNQHHQHHAPPSNPTHYQQVQQSQQQQQQLLIAQQQLLAPHYRSTTATSSSSSTLPPRATSSSPIIDPAVISLPQWTTFLTLLDPELITLATTLSSPTLAVNPGSFFREDEEMRMALIDSLEMPTWPKLKLKNKVKAKGMEVWKVMESMELDRRIKYERASAGIVDDSNSVGEGVASKNGNGNGTGNEIRRAISPLVGSTIPPTTSTSRSVTGLLTNAPRTTTFSSPTSSVIDTQRPIPLAQRSPPILAPLVLDSSIPAYPKSQTHSGNSIGGGGGESRSQSYLPPSSTTSHGPAWRRGGSEEDEGEDEDGLMVMEMD